MSVVRRFFVRRQVSVSHTYLRPARILHETNVRQFADDDPGDEVVGMIVDHRRSDTAIRRPYVQSVLPLFVQAKAEESYVLHRQAVVVGRAPGCYGRKLCRS